MSKHAILITAYKDPDAILDLIEFFGEEFNIYIHLDKIRKVKLIKIFFPKNQIFICPVNLRSTGQEQII